MARKHWTREQAHEAAREYDWPEYQRIATIRAKQQRHGFTIDTTEGLMRGKRGDYLAIGPHGDAWIIKKHIFEATYRPMSSEDD